MSNNCAMESKAVCICKRGVRGREKLPWRSIHTVVGHPPSWTVQAGVAEHWFAGAVRSSLCHCRCCCSACYWSRVLGNWRGRDCGRRGRWGLSRSGRPDWCCGTSPWGSGMSRWQGNTLERTFDMDMSDSYNKNLKEDVRFNYRIYACVSR